jgi:hypothetical protein
MKDELLESSRLDRSVLTVAELGDDSGDKEYWWSRTPQERLRQVEVLRRINYGHRAKQRLQRLLEIAEPERD